jgi:hypothetical protein
VGRRLAGGVALGAALCLGVCLLVAVPANRLEDGLVAHRVYVDRNGVASVTMTETSSWLPSSFPDFGVAFSVPPMWFVYQRTAFSSLESQLGYVSTVPILMGQRVRLPASGGAFVTWTTESALAEGMSRAQGAATTLAGHPARVAHVAPLPGCRRLGGDREVLASIALTQKPKDPTFLFVQSCLAGDDRSLDQDVARLLASIAFDGR